MSENKNKKLELSNSSIVKISKIKSDVEDSQSDEKLLIESGDREIRSYIRMQCRIRTRKAYNKLRETVPTLKTKRRWTSRLEVIKHTGDYILELQKMLKNLKEEKNLQSECSYKSLYQ